MQAQQQARAMVEARREELAKDAVTTGLAQSDLTVQSTEEIQQAIEDSKQHQRCGRHEAASMALLADGDVKPPAGSTTAAYGATGQNPVNHVGNTCRPSNVMVGRGE
ncbi:hypothetical protein [Thalassospira alkalitolerans]|uniref:hypothetical protein n=1 Tax=Thalassospira alkalitolerans TaxID=1293890 RepID=UPI003AA9AF84